MLVRETFGLFRRIGQHALAFVAQGKIDGSGNLFPDSGVTLDLFPDRFHRRMRAQETIRQGLVFAQQSQKQVFGLNIRRAELAGLVPRKEDDAPGFLCIAFEHNTDSPRAPAERPTPPPNPDPTSIMHLYRLIAQRYPTCSNPSSLTFGCSGLSLLSLYPRSTLDLCSRIVLFCCLSLRRKRLRRHFFHCASIQP